MNEIYIYLTKLPSTTNRKLNLKFIYLFWLKIYYSLVYLRLRLLGIEFYFHILYTYTVRYMQNGMAPKLYLLMTSSVMGLLFLLLLNIYLYLDSYKYMFLLSDSMEWYIVSWVRLSGFPCQLLFRTRSLDFCYVYEVSDRG